MAYGGEETSFTATGGLMIHLDLGSGTRPGGWYAEAGYSFAPVHIAVNEDTIRTAGGLWATIGHAW
jgi:hypothetical protein